MGGKSITEDEIGKWIRMHVDDGLTFAEIAKREGRSRKSVSEKVRKHLKKEGRKEAKNKIESSKKGKLAAEAVRLFSDGCKPTEVVQKLEIDPELVKDLYKIG